MSGGLIAGSCLCGGTGYQLEADGVLVLSHCHCAMCRRASGAAFASFVMVLVADFAWTKGDHLINKYESSKGIFRCHCSCCGSPLPMQDPNLSLMVVPVGSLDSYPRDLQHIETFTDDALSFMRNKHRGGLFSLFGETLPEEAIFEETIGQALVDKLSDASALGSALRSARKAEDEEVLHLTSLSFRQRESAAYWQSFLDKVNIRRVRLGLDAFPADFLKQIAQRGDVG